MDFATILDESARRHPDRVALTTADGSLTFGELSERAARLAGALARLGLEPGDRLALLLPNGPDLVVALLAAARAELIAVPVLPVFTPPQVGYVLAHSGARGLISTPRLLANVPTEARAALRVLVTTAEVPGAVLLGDLFDAPPAAPVRTAPDPIGLILYTSGTTSRPKGVAHSQRRMARRVDLFVAELGLTAGDSTVVVAFAGRPALLLGQVLPMLRVGGRSDLLGMPEPAAFWARYAATRPTYMLMSPGFAVDLVEHPAAACDHSQLRFWITGGDKVTPLLHRRMAEVVGRPLLEMCGMTEAGFYAINPPTGPIKVGSIGLAMRGVAVRLTAPDNADVPPGEVGRVVVRTPDLMIGYWNDTLLTHRVLRDGWLDTGDLAWADEDGYLWFAGREKDIISRGGSKVAPAMVEEALSAHPAIASAAVVAAADARYGQVPFAFYRVCDGHADPGQAALTAWLVPRLDAPSVPVGYAPIDRWPVTDQGKLDRARLRRLADGPGADA